MFGWLFRKKPKPREGHATSPHWGLLYTPWYNDSGAVPVDPDTAAQHHRPDCDPGTPADAGGGDGGGGHSCGGGGGGE